MTLKPQLIRADTLDLQDHDTPSAQDHGRNPHPAPLGAGPAAPHQEQTLRMMNQERGAEQNHMADPWSSGDYSGRSSHEGSELLEQDMRMSSEEARFDENSLEQNGDETSSADGEGEEMMDDRMSSSPSIDDNEDIDPDFVYALHNFVATVEGQANAAKGDSMVLLDDTNSYWWLVRLVKDSSIGYLPAEHIELPVEREARQNKHRNLELARTHLTDQENRSKNPLKKAMRRRNAKKVEFSTPTFYEASEKDWSEDENGSLDDSGFLSQDQQQQQQDGRNQDVNAGDDQGVSADDGGVVGSDQQAGGDSMQYMEHPDEQDYFDEQNDQGAQTSRTGTVRNTDSFFGDDGIEPRKISLTPNLLRDQNGQISNRSSASTVKPDNSSDMFEEVEKPSSPVSERPNEKKRKEKKSGMLSGLFKRKDKKIKVDEAAGGTVVKTETEPVSPTASAGNSSPVSASSPTSSLNSSLNKRSPTGGKLTKPPPASLVNPVNNSPRSPSESRFTPGPQLGPPPREPPPAPHPATASLEPTSTVAEQFRSHGVEDQSYAPHPATASLEPTSTVAEHFRSVGVEDQSYGAGSYVDEASHPSTAPLNSTSTVAEQFRSVGVEHQSYGAEPYADEAPHPSTAPLKPTSTVAEQFRSVGVEDQSYGSESYADESSMGPDTSSATIEGPYQHDRSAYDVEPTSLSQSYVPQPYDLSPDAEEPQARQSDVPELQSSRGGTETSKDSSAGTITPPSPVEENADDQNDRSLDGRTNLNHEQQVPQKPPSGDDAVLRAFFDGRNNQDAKDLLLLVNDHTDVKPLPLDHPTMLGFGFHEHQRQLNEMSRQLDAMLNGFLARKAARPKRQQT